MTIKKGNPLRHLADGGRKEKREQRLTAWLDYTALVLLATFGLVSVGRWLQPALFASLVPILLLSAAVIAGALSLASRHE